jgi:hypothetical protein
MLQQLPIGDRVFLIFAVRRTTLGDELPIRERCPECQKLGLFMIDLKEDLDVKPMKDPRQRVHDLTLPSTRKARVHVATGEDEERMTKILRKNKREDALSHSIMMRLELLDDVKPTLEMVKSLGMRDRHYLRRSFEDIEGGVDTKLEYECAECGCEWEKDLDLKASGFFFPGDQQTP